VKEKSRKYAISSSPHSSREKERGGRKKREAAKAIHPHQHCTTAPIPSLRPFRGKKKKGKPKHVAKNAPCTTPLIWKKKKKREKKGGKGGTTKSPRD